MTDISEPAWSLRTPAAPRRVCGDLPEPRDCFVPTTSGLAKTGGGGLPHEAEVPIYRAPSIESGVALHQFDYGFTESRSPFFKIVLLLVIGILGLV